MTEIQAPVTKAVVSLGAGAGASAASQMVPDPSFWPHTATEWMAFIASAVACAYSLHLLWDFYWKKVWKPFCKRKGWLRWLTK